MSNTQLELAATEADRARAREIMDELDRVGCFRQRAAFCDECEIDIDFDEAVDHEGRTETEYAILRGLVAHRLAVEASK